MCISYSKGQGQEIKSMIIKMFQRQHSREQRYFENKTGTSQVGAVSKAQKAKRLFFEKKLSENVA